MPATSVFEYEIMKDIGLTALGIISMVRFLFHRAYRASQTGFRVRTESEQTMGEEWRWCFGIWDGLHYQAENLFLAALGTSINV